MDSGLVVAAFVARWGAEQLAAPLKAVRLRYGFTGAAGGPPIPFGSARPDVGINTVSAITGTASIGLGSMLGSTVVSIPITVAVAYAAVRRNRSDSGGGDGQADAEADEQAGELRVQRQSVFIDALPYLAIIALFALLVLPGPWRGPAAVRRAHRRKRVPDLASGKRCTEATAASVANRSGRRGRPFSPSPASPRSPLAPTRSSPERGSWATPSG